MSKAQDANSTKRRRAERSRAERDPAPRKEERVLDAFEAMQQRRKGRLTDWPVEMDDDPEDVA